VLDGGGLVTLSGGGSSRILLLDSGFDTPTPRLVVQRLTFRDGKSPATGADTAQGGAAIHRDGGSLTVLDSVFDGNHAPATGQDVAGGAIYGFGGGDTLVAGSTFTGNPASDGRAIGSLQGGQLDAQRPLARRSDATGHASKGAFVTEHRHASSAPVQVRTFVVTSRSRRRLAGNESTATTPVRNASATSDSRMRHRAAVDCHGRTGPGTARTKHPRSRSTERNSRSRGKSHHIPPRPTDCSACTGSVAARIGCHRTRTHR
jgi:hypothetical protein